MLLLRLIFVLFVLVAMGYTVITVLNSLMTEIPLDPTEMFLAGVATTTWMSMVLLPKRKVNYGKTTD